MRIPRGSLIRAAHRADHDAGIAEVHYPSAKIVENERATSFFNFFELLACGIDLLSDGRVKISPSPLAKRLMRILPEVLET